MSKPAWSFSSIEMYRNCPHQYHEVRVLKKWKDIKTAERDWGDAVHKALKEALVNGTPMPAGMEVWQKLVDQFKTVKGKLIAEEQWAINENWQPTEWFARDAWLRVILDALWIDGKVAKTVDWKTGKPKRGSDQLALFALAIFMLFPEVEEVRTMFVWLKNGTTSPETFTRNDVPRLWELYSADYQRLEQSHLNNVWPKRTSGLCSQWCSVLSCEFNGKRRHWDGK